MNFLNRNAGVIALVAIVIAIGGYFYPQVQSAIIRSFGGITNYDEVDASAMRIGSGCNNGVGSSCTASRIDAFNTSTCNLVGSAYTIAATSSALFDCAATGVVSGDNVDINFSTSTVATNLVGWLITGRIASTTQNGFITLRVSNLTGASAVLPAELASSTAWMIVSKATSAPGL